MKKRIISMLLAIFMVAGMLPTAVFAADVVASGTCGTNVNWTLDSDGVLTISGEGAMTDYRMVAQRGYHNYVSQIKSIVIEKDVTAIGNNAFYGCGNLEKLTIKGDLAKIGTRAFYSCNALKDITYYGIVAPEYNSNSGLGNLSITVTVPENYPVNTFADLEVSKTLPSGSGEATLPIYAVSILQRDTGVAVKSIVSGGEVAEGAVHGKDLTVVFEITREGGTPDEVYFDYLTIGTKEYDFQDAECPITLDDLTVTIPGELVDGAIVVDTGIMVKVTVDMAGGYLKDTDIAKKMWTVVDGVVTLTKDYAQHGFGGWYNWNECFAKEGYTLKEITTNLPQHGPYNPPHDGPVLDADIALTLVWECEHETKAVDNGDGTHTVTCVCGEEKGETIEHTFENHFCQCGAQEAAYLYSYSLSLKGNIAINYYMHLAEEILADETAFMRFTLADGQVIEIPVSQAIPQTRSSDTYYVFSCAVDAKEMTDVVKAQFFYGDCATQEYGYNVQSYAEYMLENETDEKLLALVKALLHYGSAAQTHFGYNTGDLADAELEAPDYSAVTIPSYDVAAGQGTENVKFHSAALILKSETTLRFFFTAPFTAEYNGNTLEVKERNGLYYVDVIGISAKDLDENVTIAISDGENTAEVTYNPMAYCAAVQADATGAFDQKMKNLVTALYLYNQAANMYLEEN